MIQRIKSWRVTQSLRGHAHSEKRNTARGGGTWPFSTRTILHRHRGRETEATALRPRPGPDGAPHAPLLPQPDHNRFFHSRHVPSPGAPLSNSSLSPFTGCKPKPASTCTQVSSAFNFNHDIWFAQLLWRNVSSCICEIKVNSSSPCHSDVTENLFSSSKITYHCVCVVLYCMEWGSSREHMFDTRETRNWTLVCATSNDRIRPMWRKFNLSRWTMEDKGLSLQ